MNKVFAAAAALLFSLAVPWTASPPVHAHPHGPPLETKLMPYPFWTEPLADDIYHVPTGTKISQNGMMDMLAGGRVIFIGEVHNNVHSHRMQLEILDELNKRFPGRIAVGMEMFREPQQASLDRWTRGELGEAEFLKESMWYDMWRSDYGYYRDIMNFARDNRIDVIALNPPEDLQRAFGMSAEKDLDPEMAAQLPDIDPSDPFQRAMVGAVYGAHDGGEKMQEAFVRIQLLWEEHMAERIVEYLGSPGGEEKIMVVLAGGGHVEYGFGVPKRVIRRKPMPYYVVLPAIISSPDEEAEEEQLYMDVEMPEFPLLSGDFIWTIPYELIDDRKVRMGILMAPAMDGVVVEEVLDDSPAYAAGIMAGDILLSLDSLAVEKMSDVLLVIKSKKVGDTLTVVVRRNDENLTLSTRFTEPAG